MRYYKIIDDETVFYNGESIVIGDVRYLPPVSEEILLQAGWLPYTPPEPTEEELLAQAKANKVAEIDAYDQSDAVNVFYLAGQPLWLDAATRQQLRTSINAYKDMGQETVSKWFGGQQYTFPVSLWLTMLNALEVYAGNALNVTEANKAAVMALESVEDVEAYDITQGYPEPINLTPQWLQQHS